MPKPLIIPIGAFSEGMDSLHAEDDPIFDAIAGPNGYSSPKRCVAAVNVDLDDRGRPELRDGTTQRVAATSGLSAFCGLGMAVFQDQGTIKRVTDTATWTTADVVTGLNASAEVIFHEYENWILWTNGLESGKIDSTGAYQPWSLTRPAAPTLGETSGTLPAGRYRVSVLYVDANGVEHAASESAVITLASPAAITVDVPAPDSEAALIRVFASKTNGTDLFFVGSAVPGVFPVTVSDVAVSDEPLRTRGFSPVVPGDGIFSFGGMVITFHGRYLQPSFGPAIHLFELHRTEEERPGVIQAGGGLEFGFWLVCERGAYFTKGDVPGAWVTSSRKDARQYAKGCLVLDADLVGGVDALGDVALFVSDAGLMCGTSDGRMLALTDDKHQLDVVGKTADIVYRQHSGIYPPQRTTPPQILFTLR